MSTGKGEDYVYGIWEYKGTWLKLNKCSNSYQEKDKEQIWYLGHRVW